MGFLYVTNATGYPVRVTVFRGRIKRHRLTVWLTADELATPPGHRLVVACTINGLGHEAVMIPVALREGKTTLDIKNRIGAMYDLSKDDDDDTILQIEGYYI